MSGGIYLIQDGGRLVEMKEQDYASEDLLQKLLADYPNLLAGDQIDSVEPRRWLLVSHEVSLASEEDGAGRWSVDHLFLDQDAIPTIVEVKRSTDTRIRREVVGQMLDYAANAVVYWPVEALRVRLNEGQEEPEQKLYEFLGPETDLEGFWKKVKTNLQAGKVRLIFVADKIPAELRRVVEFLNQQMDPAEVLAVEIKQYVGGNMKTLVPRIIGQTEEAKQKRSGGGGGLNRSNEEAFYKELEDNQGFDEAAIVKEIQKWAARPDKLPRFEWRSTGRRETFEPCSDYKGPHFPLRLGTDGKVTVNFQFLKGPFGKEEKREELLQRLNQISGVDIPADRINGQPSFPLSILKDEAALKQFLEVLDWFVQEVKAT